MTCLSSLLPSMAHMKARFRQLKYDLAWLVDCLLRTCYTSPDNGDTEPPSPSPHTLDLDSFLAAVTAILSEKLYVILCRILDCQNKIIPLSNLRVTGKEQIVVFVAMGTSLVVTQASQS